MVGGKESQNQHLITYLNIKKEVFLLGIKPKTSTGRNLLVQLATVWYIQQTLPVRFSKPQEQLPLLPWSFEEGTLPVALYNVHQTSRCIKHTQINNASLSGKTNIEQNQTHICIQQVCIQRKSTWRLFKNFKKSVFSNQAHHIPQPTDTLTHVSGILPKDTQSVTP